jgi:TP901 family phage tail tape measure protein
MMADKAKNVVLNFKMDGQVQYAQTLKQINAVMNTAAKEYKNHIAAMGQDASATDKLRAEKKKLEIQMDGAQKRTKMLRDEYEAMSKDTKTTTDQLTKMYGKLLDAENAEIKLQQSMEKVSKGLSDQAEEARQAQDSLDKLRNESKLLEAEQKSLTSAFKLQNAELGENADESEKLELSQKQLTSQMELTDRAVKNLEKQLASTKKVYGDNSVEVLQLEKRINDTKSSVLDFKKSLDKLENSGEEAEKSVGGLGDGFSEVGGAIAGATGPAGEFIENLASAPWAAIAAGVAAVGTAAVTAAIEFDKADSKIQASLGLTKEQARELGEVAEEVWSNGFGENVDEVASAVAGLYNTIGNIPKNEMVELTKGIITLSEVFDVDMNEGVTAVNTVMKNFKVDGQTALDLITYSAQKTSGVFKTDLADALTELAPTLNGMGATGEQAFSLLITASKSGMENFDALSSLTQTFADNLISGGEDMDTVYKNLGGTAEATWSRFKSGNASAYEVLINTAKQLGNVDDKTRLNQTGAMLFGDVWTEAGSEAILSLGNVESKLKDVEGASKNAGKAMHDNISDKVKARAREIGSSLEEIAYKVIYFAAVMEEKQPEIAETFDLFGENISKGTQKAVGAFLELNNQATTQVNLLKSNVVPVSQETADQVSEIFGTMATQVRDAISQRQTETLESMQTFFATSSALTAEEEANALAKMTSNYDVRSQLVTDGENRIKEILQTAFEEKRTTTNEEEIEIAAIRASFQAQAIDMMTQSEAEQKSILERLKAESTNITAQQAAQVVQNSLKQKDETIAAAEEQYNRTVQEIIRQRDETGSITAEQADKLIADAKRQKDNSVAEAQIMHRDVVKEAKAMASESVDEIDWSTGKIIGDYEQMQRDVVKFGKGMYKDVKEFINDIVEFLDGIEFKLPEFDLPKMPEFDLKYKSETIMGKKIKYPTGFDVDYRAQGAIFTQPTIFGMMGNRLQVAGDAGAEAALPLTPEVLGDIGRGIASTMNGFNQPLVVQLMTPDERVFAEWLVDPITEMQDSKRDIGKQFEGRRSL